MARVPIQNRELTTRPIPTGNSRPMLSAPRIALPHAPDTTGMISNAQQNLAGAVQDLGNSFASMAIDSKRKGDNVALISAQSKLDDWENQTLFDPVNGALNKKGKDALNLPNSLGAGYDKNAQGIYDSLANDDQRAAFSQMAVSRRDSVMKTAFRHEREQLDSFANEQVNTAIDTAVVNAQLNYTDPAAVEKSINNAKGAYLAYAQTQGKSRETIALKLRDIDKKARIGVIGRMIEANPEGFLETAEAAPAGNSFESAVAWTMKEEGGFVSNDAGKGPTNMGINKEANPDVDVENLTPEQAKAIYKKRYWNAIDGDHLPPELARVAFDAAVNHGVGKAKEMLAASGGDVQKLLDLRQAEYDRLATENPAKYGEFKDTWDNRLKKLGKDSNEPVLSGIPSFDSLDWDERRQLINAATTEVNRRDARYEKALTEYQERNGFDLYSQIVDPKTRSTVTQQSIIGAVGAGKVDPKDGRTLLTLLTKDESREDDLAAFADLSQKEAAGTLTTKDVIDAHANGKLKAATAQSLIKGITSNLSENEAYKSGQSLIKAEFARTDFGVVQGDAAIREAEALREYQRRSSQGENPLAVADEITVRLKKTETDDRTYQSTLSTIRRDLGVPSMNNIEQLEEAADKIMDAGKRKVISEDEMNQKLGALQRKIQELESGKP